VDGQVQNLVYEFGEFQLDARRGVLRSRNGQPLELTPKAFGVLLYLVEHAGQLVEKATLFEEVWPNVVVEEGNLSQTIHILRRALGEHPDDHRFIVTVPGRGYRFVAPVNIRTAPDAHASAASQAQPAAKATLPPRFKLIAGVLLTLSIVLAGVFAMQQYRESHRTAAIGPVHSIAVLPFQDMSPSGDNAYFADGLSEEVLNLLAQIPDLRVIARTSSFSFRDHNADIATIAHKLNVDHVLEGSVRKSGNRVRVTAQLVEGANSSHVWSATYERQLDDIFAVQSEIAAAVAQALQSKLGVRAAPANQSTQNADAYEQFLKGQFFYNRRGPGDLEKALDCYERAVELDPHYARAWAGVAAIWYIQTQDNIVPLEAGMPRLLEAAQNALRYDPGLAEAHLRLAGYYWLKGEPIKSKEHMRRGAQLNPNSPLLLGWQAGAAMDEDRYDEAIAIQRRAVALDPLSALSVGNLGGFLFAAGRLEEAKAELLRAHDLSPQSNHAAAVGQILILQRKFDDALAIIESATQGADREEGLALVYHALGRSAEADAALQRLIALSADNDPFRIAEVYAFRDDADEAFKWLALASRPSGPIGTLPGPRVLWEVRASPLLASLQDDSRWKVWMAESALQ
jgi:TolB-like protein/DNA-binding winged helix-turn-helix (wHTH) protein